jgi:hypothetical protein
MFLEEDVEIVPNFTQTTGYSRRNSENGGAKRDLQLFG